jgi:hypothetical protein
MQNSSHLGNEVIGKVDFGTLDNTWVKNVLFLFVPPQHCVVWEFGTNSVQLRERKNGSLAPSRHQMKHLDFLSFLLESR